MRMKNIEKMFEGKKVEDIWERRANNELAAYVKNQILYV